MEAQETHDLRELMRYELNRPGPPPGFPTLPDLPARRYTDPEFFALEQKYLWRKSWLLAGHLDELPEPGSYRLWELAGQPVLLFRGRDGEVRAFYNLCRHRGAALVVKESGRTPRLACGYHGWTYDDEGHLISIRDPRDFGPDFDMSCRSLYRLRCERFGNLIFVNFDPEAVPLLSYLGPLADQWAEFDFGRTRLVDNYVWDLDCNWKIAMEANLEVYHVKSIHPVSVHTLLDYEQNVNTLYPGGHARMVAPTRPEVLAQVGGRRANNAAFQNEMPEITTAGEISRTCTQSYNVVPNIVSPMSEGGFPMLLFWPNGLTKTRFQVIWLGADWGKGERPKGWDARIASFNDVLLEDTEFGKWIQQAVMSEVYESVPLSYQEARIYHLHQRIDEVIGPERVPEPLRVKPVLTSDWMWPHDTRRRLELSRQMAAE